MSWHPETVTSVSLTPRVSIFSRGFRDKADLGIDLCGTVVTADMSGLSTKQQSTSLHMCQQAVLLHVSVSGSFSRSCPDFPDGRTHL